MGSSLIGCFPMRADALDSKGTVHAALAALPLAAGGLP
jgi:hypothetical protein